MGKELDRIYRLAKAWAKIENDTAIVYRNEDGTYGFTSISNENEIGKPIVEFVTPY